MNTMESTGSDFSNTFCCFRSADVSDCTKVDESFDKLEENILKQCYSLDALLKSSKSSLDSRQLQQLMQLINLNPEILSQIGRTGLVIEKLKMQLEKSNKLEKMSAEDKIKHDQTAWKNWLEKYKLRVRKEMETCDDLSKYNTERVDVMQKSNPSFILRNYILQNAIDKAEKGDFSEVQRILKMLESPYEQTQEDVNNLATENINWQYDSGPSTSFGTESLEAKRSSSNVYNKCPDWAFSLKVT